MIDLKLPIYRLLSILIIFNIIVYPCSAQKKELSYYLPEQNYNPDILTPEAFLGYQVGEWHVSHDQLKFYMEYLAKVSDRVTIESYAYTHEHRPLQLLTISSPENQKNINTIQANQEKLSNGEDINKANHPAIVYQGYSIHGNESSGSNAAVLVAYYLAAGQGEEVMKTLDELVILLDPCYNPDGLTRFATWANGNRYANLISDPQSREYNEPWPRGRTNHYWFDLNRDWLLLTHPESKGRIKNFHKWNPNILTDHHEMGTNSTFFFQPGIPSRTNPNTPQINQDLTEEIGTFHASALDQIGSLYYSKESFDDFYYGKGSTYPDANGCVGILFEQASSRGHLQESANGLLSFPFTIRNQVVTSLSTQRAAVNMKDKLLAYKQDFFKDASSRARAEKTKAYIFKDRDSYKLNRFINTLLAHKVEVHQVSNTVNKDGKSYTSDNSYIVDLNQKQHTLAKTIFESVNSFKDSLFYDVSAWTLPLAYDLDYAALSSGDFKKGVKGERITDHPIPAGKVSDENASYGFAIPWYQYMAPKLVYDLLEKGLTVKIASEPFILNPKGKKMKMEAGTVILPLNNQKTSAEEIRAIVKSLSTEHHVNVVGIESGITGKINLGSPQIRSIEQPKIALISGTGTVSYDVGELWHHLDKVMNIPFTMLDKAQFWRADLSKYDVIILPDGRYNDTDFKAEKLEEWITDGGTVIAFENAINYLNGKKLITVTNKKTDAGNLKNTAYNKYTKNRGAQVIGGAIFETKIDLTNPLAYGYNDPYIPMFKKGTNFFEPTKNKLATPASYTATPLLSGYVSKPNIQALENSAAIMVFKKGGGKIICFTDDLVFRGYWWGTSKLFANAIFFADLISGAAEQ